MDQHKAGTVCLWTTKDWKLQTERWSPVSSNPRKECTRYLAHRGPQKTGYKFSVFEKNLKIYSKKD